MRLAKKTPGRTRTEAAHEGLYRMTVSAMFIAIGIILPFFTGQIQTIGEMMLPMHIPVMLCGLLCGWQYGAVVGAMLPILRSLLFGMPVIYPNALAMAVELTVYGMVVGLIYGAFRRQGIWAVYAALIPAMLVGRAAWGGMQVLLLGFGEGGFTTEMFMVGAFTKAIPGILLQLVLIPSVMTLLHYTGTKRFRGKGEGKHE